MSLLLTTEEAIMLRALASGQIRLRIRRKQYRVKRILGVTSFGFTAVLERNGRTSTQEVMFQQFEVYHSDVIKWFDDNAETIDDDLQRLHERSQPVRPQ